MATKIVYDYGEMEALANKIETTYVQKYQEAAATLKTNLDTSTAGWTGQSKDKFKGLMKDNVYPYLEDKVPEMIASLAKVLRNNMKSMQDADKQVASQISGK